MKRIGIIGAGVMADAHSTGMKLYDNVELAGFYSRTKSKCEEKVNRYGGKVYETVEDMLGDSNVDIIDICVPNSLHEEFALKAIAAGKHVLIEKPFTLTLDSAERILAAAKEKGVKLMVAQCIRFWPEYKKIKEVVDSGDIGDVEMVYASRLAQMPNWGDGWYSDFSREGDVLFCLALHDIDFLRYMLGPVKSLYATGIKANGGYQETFTIFNYMSGAKAIVDDSLSMTPGYPFTMILRAKGTKGTVEFIYKSGVNIGPDSTSSLTLYRDGFEPLKIKADVGDAYGEEISYFANCIEENKDPVKCLPEECREVIEIILKVKESMETGRTIEL